jgi:hypothetical protein
VKRCEFGDRPGRIELTGYFNIDAPSPASGCPQTLPQKQMAVKVLLLTISPVQERHAF